MGTSLVCLWCHKTIVTEIFSACSTSSFLIDTHCSKGIYRNSANFVLCKRCPRGTWKTSCPVRKRYLYCPYSEHNHRVLCKLQRDLTHSEVVVWTLEHKDQWREKSGYRRLTIPEDVLQLKGWNIPFPIKSSVMVSRSMGRHGTPYRRDCSQVPGHLYTDLLPIEIECSSINIKRIFMKP
jgi:hypothetical protein